MRRAAVLLCLALAACSGSKGTNLAPLRASAALAPCPSAIGDVSSLKLPCLGGGHQVQLRGTATGVPTLVNVYASWCDPCQREMPRLAAFAKRADGKVAVLGVDTLDEDRLALLFAKYVGQHWPAVVDGDGTFMRRYSPGPPVTLFVDAQGHVAFVKVGELPSLAAIVALVKQHLGVVV